MSFIIMERFNEINITDIAYPQALKEIPDPPEKIYVSGKLPPEPPADGPKIAIVGTRKATAYGRQIAKETTRKLADKGIIIVSGLAMGIDTAAHEGCLEADGTTIAVLANGLNEIYPRQNEKLAKKILKTGVIISEYPVNTPSFRNQFLKRNRIISGLSAATIVIEAPERSGSLATARFAAEQGREVFVFPGPANHPNYRGSHKLIRDGARLISSVEDVLEDLNINQNLKIKNQNDNLKFKINNKNQLLVFKTIQEAGESLTVDKITKLTKLEPQIVNQTIAFLTIQGIIKETEKGYAL